MKKKILIIISLIMVLIIFTACGENYKFKALQGGPLAEDKIIDGNGGLCVRKGEYIFFINGMSDYADDNAFGTPVKGAIYRSKINSDGTLSDPEVMAPKMFYNRNEGGGLYIEGQKLYYSSPSIEKNKNGEVLYYYSDIFSVNLDGTKTKRIGTVDRFDSSKFVTINSKVYFVYEMTESVDGEDVKKVYALGEDGKTSLIAEKYVKALYGDDGYLYYTKTVSKPDGDEIEGVENYNKVWKRAFVNGTEEEVLLNGKNISENKYSISLEEFKDGVLYYSKNYSSAGNRYYAYKNSTVLELTYLDNSNPYFLGFDSNGKYKGTLFYYENEIILLKPGVHNPVEITSLDSEPKYLFMEGNVMYLMISNIMYSVNIFDTDDEPKFNDKIKLTDFKTTFNLEKLYPKKLGDYIYFIGDAQEEYYKQYLYRYNIVTKPKEEPVRLGYLSVKDDELRKEAEDS